MTMLMGQIRLETKLFLRDKRSLFLTFAFPAMMILIFGSVFGSQTVAGLPAINYILPGIVVMALMMVCMNNITTKIVNEREKGVYRRLSLTPLKRQTLLIGDIVIRYLIALVSILVLIAIGNGVFKTNISGSYFLFLLVLTLGAVIFMALGFILSSLVKNANSAMTLTMAVFFPLMFLGGCFFTLDGIPTALRTVCDALPTTHLNNALRLITMQGAGFSQIWPELPVMLGWLAGSLILAVKLFKWE